MNYLDDLEKIAKSDNDKKKGEIDARRGALKGGMRTWEGVGIEGSPRRGREEEEEEWEGSIREAIKTVRLWGKGKGHGK